MSEGLKVIQGFKVYRVSRERQALTLTPQMSLASSHKIKDSKLRSLMSSRRFTQSCSEASEDSRGYKGRPASADLRVTWALKATRSAWMLIKMEMGSLTGLRRWWGPL